MATQRYISTSFWDDAWVQSIDPSEKLLYLYLMTSPLTNIAGIYKITDKRIHDDTGFNIDMVHKLLDRFAKARKAYREGEYIIIPTWPKHQKWQDKPTIETGIRKVLAELPNSIRDKAIKVGYLYPIDTVPISYPYSPSYSDIDPDIDLDPELDTDKDLDHTTAPFVAEVPEPSKAVIVKPKQTALYHAIRQCFLAKTPTFANYAKEALAIKRIEAFAGRYSPDDRESATLSLIAKYWELVQSQDKFWHKQPFTPAGLGSLMDRVARELEINRPQTREEYEDAYAAAREVPF